METNKKTTRKLFAFMATILFLTGTVTLSGQITCPYPVTNNTPCTLQIGHEIAVAPCTMCSWGNITILPGQTLLLGGSCCPILDVHIVAAVVDGCGIVGADVGEMTIGCINSTGTINSSPVPFVDVNGTTCPCMPGTTLNISYSPTGTTIW